MPSDRGVTVEEMLAHGDWVRALARSLVARIDDAEDVEQDTWVAALAKPPAHGRNLRAWFARVVRRRRLDAQRTAARRVRRERHATPPGPCRPSEELLTRAELRARLAQEVMRLEEPYRSTILLRFFEDLPPREIARIQGIPVATVGTRSRRAVAELRRRLGGPTAVRRLLAPLVGSWPAVAARLGTEVLVGTTKSKVWMGVLAALVVAGGTSWVVLRSSTRDTGRDGVDAPGGERVVRDESGAHPTLAAAPPAESAEVARVGTREQGVLWEVRDGARAGPSTVEGRVTDELGRPRVRTAAFLWEQGDPARQRDAATDGEGRFRFEGVGEGTHTLWLRAAHAELNRRVRAGGPALEVMLLLDPPYPEGVRRVRAAPAGVLGGTVSDEDGRGLTGCEVRLLDEAGRVLLQTTSTDAQGDFRFERLEEGLFGLGFAMPRTEYVLARARVGQWLAVTLTTPPRIAGVVFEAGTERPVPDLPIVLFRAEAPATGPRHSRTGADGSFSFEVDDGPWRLALGDRFLSEPETAADRFLYAVVGPFSGRSTGLRIGVERGSVIEGLLRGPDGAPWTRGAAVYAHPITPEGKLDWERVRGVAANADGTFRIPGLPKALHDVSVKRLDRAPPDVEAIFGLVRRVAAGTRDLVVDLRAGRTVVVRLADEAGTPLALEGGWIQVRPWGSEPGGPEAVSAARREDGRFESPPLDPAPMYMVAAGGFRGYSGGEVTRVSAGDTDVVLRLEGVPFSGRLVDKGGEPVAETVVQAWAIGRDRPTHAWTETESDGRFRIPGAPRGPVDVVASVGGRWVKLGEHTAPADGVVLRLP